ncbi:hypothetical protein [Aliirhizobium cellulosilyticum]|uniref:Uncharacterized protein n=1 Tax=Aliirhizobium cellulosilyticum TaxID=393664 RepID=A0A7W6WPV6_9HYPH|nr:hypothetical protein [Rhizobium cellulosilyticum]MBB4349279.1 hypothetical protein [Rhizobium cellulosilyticum]MBB4412499.1 hypothetical protein [Rhizobium cellulosilyticum]MBB4447131.1 hypothetical protein [Rhizobium cellulosilyticum]
MHPTILNDSSGDGYSLNLVAFNDSTTLPPMPAGQGYISQNVLFGPDAAVEVKNGKITLYMMGEITLNSAFHKFVRRQERAVLTAAEKLATNVSDIVVFIGKWYHVDYDINPLFRPYIIRIDRSNGQTEVQPSKANIFWTDEENEYLAYEEIEAEKLASGPADVFRAESERAIRRFMSYPFTSGFYSWSGFLWHPTVAGYPVVYVPLGGVISHRKKHLWKGGDQNDQYLKTYRAVDTALGDFKSVLSGDLDIPVSTAFSQLQVAIKAMPNEEDRADMHDYVIALLGDQRFDETTGSLKEKIELPLGESITLKEIQVQTKAKGYWIIQRDDDRPGELQSYCAFLYGRHQEDQDILLHRCSPVCIEGFDEGCSYASDWISSEYGQFRYVAFGPERALSW